MAKEKDYQASRTFQRPENSAGTNSALYVTACGAGCCCIYGHTAQNIYHIHYILEGTVILKINDRTYRLHSGQIFVQTPFMEIRSHPDDSIPCYEAWISFGGTQAAFLMESFGMTAESPVRDTDIEPSVFLALTEKILKHPEAAVSDEFMRTSLLYETAALLASSGKPDLNTGKSAHGHTPDIYVECAIAYIHCSYSSITVRDIADRIGISRSYLSHIFKKKLDVSPQQYLVNYRLEKGSQLLRTTSFPVRVISEKTGYSNPLTFSKMFKKNYGISPTGYRSLCTDEFSLLFT